MRAKFQVQSVASHLGHDGAKYHEVLGMAPVCKTGAYPADGLDEDNTFAKWSPSGSLSLTITNPALWDQFKPGQKFYIDFTPAE
jgi:hypothetical protein